MNDVKSNIYYRMISLGIMLAIYHSFDYETDSAANFPKYECQSTFDYFTSGYIVLLFATNLLEFLVSWLSSKGMRLWWWRGKGGDERLGLWEKLGLWGRLWLWFRLDWVRGTRGGRG